MMCVSVAKASCVSFYLSIGEDVCVCVIVHENCDEKFDCRFGRSFACELISIQSLSRVVFVSVSKINLQINIQYIKIYNIYTYVIFYLFKIVVHFLHIFSKCNYCF